MSRSYKPTQTSSLFPEEFRLEKLSKQGDPLERLNKFIGWDFFRETVDGVIPKERLVKAGPKRYDPLLMFKILILQRYYNLSDEQIEFQILDRLTFCRFLGLSLNDKVPDEKTIWTFREQIINKGIDKQLFTLFEELLDREGLIAHEGKIIDASFVIAPVNVTQRKKTKRLKQVPHQKNGKKQDQEYFLGHGCDFNISGKELILILCRFTNILYPRLCQKGFLNILK